MDSATFIQCDNYLLNRPQEETGLLLNGFAVAVCQKAASRSATALPPPLSSPSCQASLCAEPFHIVTSPWHVKHKMPFGCPAHKGLFSIVSKTSLWHFCLVVLSLTGAQGLASVPLGFWEGEIVPYFRLYTVPQPQAQIKRSGAAREGWSGVCWKPFCQVGRTFLVCASRVGKRQPFQPGGTRGPGYGRLDWICSCTEHICQGSGEMYAGAKYRIT